MQNKLYNVRTSTLSVYPSSNERTLIKAVGTSYCDGGFCGEGECKVINGVYYPVTYIKQFLFISFRSSSVERVLGKGLGSL